MDNNEIDVFEKFFVKKINKSEFCKKEFLPFYNLVSLLFN